MPTPLAAAIPSPPQGVWYVGPVALRAYAIFIIIGIVVAVWWGNKRFVGRGGRPGRVTDIAVFAVCMGALTWKSGGLECAIVLHTANNLTLFLLTTFSASSTLEQGAVDPILLLISLPVTLGSTAWLWWWVSRRYGVRALEPVVEVARRGATFE